MDITPHKLGPTWHDGRSRVVSIGKRLDRFMVVGILMPLLSQHRYWSRSSKISYHYSICLDWMEVVGNPSYPFKFNHMWLKEANFTELIKHSLPLTLLLRDHDAMSHLVSKLKILKWVVIDWEHQMKHDRCSELDSIETVIIDIFLLDPMGILSTKDTNMIIDLKAHKDILLAFESSNWRLKNWAVSIELGDANTKFFQNYSSSRWNGNMIWELKGLDE